MNEPILQVPYTLRRATWADLDAVTALEAACFPPAEAADREAFDWRLRSYASHFWVLEMAGRIISFVNGPVTRESDLVDEMFASPRFCDESGEWQMIFGVATHPDYQRQGWASLVMRRFIADAKENGCKGVVLTCKELKIPFYARFGYQDEGISSSTHGGVPWHQMRLTF
ncbi:MAG: GNAT family N-acetyltransferase [Parabacteroides sp.]